MRQTIVILTNEPDEMIIEGKGPFSCLVTTRRSDKEDYAITIDFLDVNPDTLSTLADLFNLSKALSVDSKVFKKSGVDISHIVAEKMQSSNEHARLSMVWNCLSDEPGLGLEIE